MTSARDRPAGLSAVPRPSRRGAAVQAFLRRAAPGRPGRRLRQRGAALLMAMLVVALVSTLASAMIWQQWRAVQVEAAERSRLQSAWMLVGALDFARLILREDGRTGGVDSLREPWASPLAEARLSTFLAADKSNTDDALQAFLSGGIVDAQSRFNLRNLYEGGQVLPADLAVFARLCELVGVAPASAERIATRLRDASLPPALQPAGTSLMPQSAGQLGWLGIDADTLRRLAPFVVLLPEPTPVNVNTAPAEVIAAAVEGLDASGARRLVQLRERSAPFRSSAELTLQLPGGVAPSPRQIGVSTSYFEVVGRLRLADRVLQERSLLRRRGLRVQVLARERTTLQETAP